jgi:uncharacterized protein (TIRG00374 family)
MIRRWLPVVLIAGFAWMVLTHRDELLTLTRTVSAADPRLVALAVALQATYFLCWGALYRRSFAVAGVAGRLGDTVATLLCAVFLNLVVPSAGAAGATLFVDDAARRGESAARATAGVVVCWASDLAALATVFALGVGWLLATVGLAPERLAITAVLWLLVVGSSALLVAGLWHPRRLHGLLAGMRAVAARVATRFARRPPLADDWAERVGEEFAQVSTGLRAHPSRLAGTYTAALLMHAVNLASLCAVFLVFGQRAPLGAIAAGYGLGLAVWIFSPMPQGVGVVEAAMALVYAGLGIPASTATAIALTYRGLTFWLPLVVGFAMLRRMRAPGRASAEKT